MTEQVYDMHVVPLGDKMDHVVDPHEACICGPSRQPVVNDQGNREWVVVHHSLDGREQDDMSTPYEQAMRLMDQLRDSS